MNSKKKVLIRVRRWASAHAIALTVICLITTCTILVYWVAGREWEDASINEALNKATDHEEARFRWTSKRCKVCASQTAPRYYSQFRQDRDLWRWFYSKPCVCNGTYIELGAFDGVNLSNTKFFHDVLSWTGVLIEPLEDIGKELLVNRPDDYVYNHYAVCPAGMKSIEFRRMGKGKLTDSAIDIETVKKRFNRNKTEVVETPCFPGGLGGILEHAGIKAVDFLSLDVEDSELTVLETMDWTVPIGLIMVEMHDFSFSRTKNSKVKDLLTTKGYTFVRKIGGEDHLFAHPEYTNFLKSL